MARCPECNGSSDPIGLYGDGKCRHCHGSGKDWFSSVNEGITGTSIECAHCNGLATCQHCDGKGVIDVDDSRQDSFSDNKSSPTHGNYENTNLYDLSESRCDYDEESDDSSSYSDPFLPSNSRTIEHSIKQLLQTIDNNPKAVENIVGNGKKILSVLGYVAVGAVIVGALSQVKVQPKQKPPKHNRWGLFWVIFSAVCILVIVFSVIYEKGILK